MDLNDDWILMHLIEIFLAKAEHACTVYHIYMAVFDRWLCFWIVCFAFLFLFLFFIFYFFIFEIDRQIPPK